MSPRLSTGSNSPRLLCGALLLALLLPTMAHAQTPGGSEPFTSVVDSSSYLGQTPLRIWQRTRGFGEETSETMLGTHWATPLSMGLAFVDGNLRIGNSDTDFSVNVGTGFRWRNDDFFTGSPRIFGFSVWYDGEDTQLNNYFNQIGVSFERLGPLVDLRLNANIPLEDLKNGDDVVFTGEKVFSGNFLAQGTMVNSDVSLRVVDFEVAPRLFNLNAWGYGGGYQMDGQGISEFGYKAGVRGYVLNDLALDVGVSDDDQFGTNTVVQIIWTPGRVSADPSLWTHNIDDRMREQVYRNPYVAVEQVQTAGSSVLTDALGDPVRVVHVDSSAAGGGNGTFENPLNNLDLIDDNSQIGDIVLVHGGSSFTGQSATLQDAQRFLGEGNNETHLVFTSEMGSMALPETAPGASALAKPIINDAPGDAAIVLAGGNDEVETLAEIEVSNFSIDGGARGIYSPNGVGDVNINRMMIANTTGDGIELTELLETLANNTERIRFTPTIDDVMFTNIGGDDIDLNASHDEPSTIAISETIALSDITSTNPGNVVNRGIGIRLTEHKRAATISNFNWNGGTTGEGALLIQSDTTLNLTQATVAMSGTNAISGGQTGVAGEGYAIRLEQGVATHTVTGTTISNTGGDSIIANGPGTAGMNFTGRIDQTANNASILSVENGHDGNLVFTELTANAGVINATMGDGLQFNNADGVYTFNDLVTFVGTSAAVNAVNDSSGVITLADATFTNTTGDTMTFDGGTANMTLTGLVTQTANNASVLSVAGGHDGTLTFTERTASAGVINATMGDGLQFNNADGAYTFNDAVDLIGTTAGVNVTGGSSGTIAFTDTASSIMNPTANGHAVNIENSDAVFTYAGEIDTNNASGRPVRIVGNTGGSITFSGPIDSTDVGVPTTDGIFIEANTGGSVLFSGQVTINTSTENGVTIQNNTGGSVRFNNLDITTTSGTGFFATTNASPATIAVAGTGNTITTDTGVGLSLNNVNVDAAGINFASVDVTNGGANGGVFLNNVTGGAVSVGAGGANPGDGGTIVSSGSAVQITNVANVSINNMDLQSTAGNGVDYNVTTAPASRLTLNGNTIVGSLESVDLNVSAAATLANISIIENNINNTTAQEAILFTSSGGTVKTVNLLVRDNLDISNDNAASPAANFIAGGNVTLNATVQDNTFNSAAGGMPFRMESLNAQSRVRLNLTGNMASEGTAADDFFLVETAGNFSVEDLAAVAAGTENTGGVNFNPNQAAFTNDAGGIPTP